MQEDWIKVVQPAAMLSLLFSACILQPNIFEVGGDFVYDCGIGVQGMPWLFMLP